MKIFCNKGFLGVKPFTKHFLHTFMCSAGLFVLIMLCAAPLYATEQSLYQTGIFFYQRGDYYTSVTEMMRYRVLYPQGEHYAESLLFSAKAYYEQNELSRAYDTLAAVETGFTQHTAANEALFLEGAFRLRKGSPFFAYRKYQDYIGTYPDGAFTERAYVEKAYALALMDQLPDASTAFAYYRLKYPHGAYLDEVLSAEKELRVQLVRPKKSMSLAVAGSLVLPGFGHFYAGNVSIGFLQLASNAAMIGLIVHGFARNNLFEILTASFIELSFYQYSLYAAFSQVEKYNANDEYKKQLKLGIKKSF